VLLLRRWVGLIVTVTAVLVGVLALPAAAHDDLLASTPQDGATVQTVPDRVTLTFSAAPNPDFVQVAVTAADGTRLDSGTPRVDGTTIVQPLRATPPGSTVTVAYRVAGSDGHTITGSTSFTVAAQRDDAPATQDDAGGSTDDATDSSADATEAPDTEPATDREAEIPQPPSSTSTSSGDSSGASGGDSMAAPVAVGVAAAALAAGLVGWRLRRRPR
jgi:hypothetical protein